MMKITLTIPLSPNNPEGADVLMYYDGPLVMWLPHEALRLLAIALPDEAGPWPFLVVQLTHEQASALENGTLTLKGAVVASGARYLLKEFGTKVLEMALLSAVPEEWLPGDGLMVPSSDVPSIKNQR